MILISQCTAKQILFSRNPSVSTTAFLCNLREHNHHLAKGKYQRQAIPSASKSHQRIRNSFLSQDRTSTKEALNENKDPANTKTNQETKETPPVYLGEGLLAVHKPLEWTSQDVVAYIRGMLTRDARDRGAIGNKRDKGRRKKPLKVGHGGTLDPLATGVLVLGIGRGTKELQG